MKNKKAAFACAVHTVLCVAYTMIPAGVNMEGNSRRLERPHRPLMLSARVHPTTRSDPNRENSRSFHLGISLRG